MYLLRQEYPAPIQNNLQSPPEADTIAPILLSAVVSPNGVTVTLTFFEAMLGLSAAGNKFALVSPIALLATYVSGEGLKVAVFTSNVTVKATDVPVLHSVAGLTLTDLAGNAFAAVSGFPVTNLSTQV